MNSSSLDLLSLLSLLRRRILLVIGIVGLFVVGAVLALLAMTPSYTASAMVLVDPTIKNLLDPAVPRGDISDNARVESEVLIAKSGAVVRAVIAELDLYENPAYQPAASITERVMTFLRLRQERQSSIDSIRDQIDARVASDIWVQRQGLTFLLAINAEAAEPALAAAMANSAARAYITEQLQRKVESTTSARDIILSRVEKANTAATAEEQKFDNYVSTLVDQISAESGRSDIAAIRAQIEELSGAQATSSAAIDTIKAAVSTQNWDSLGGTITEPAFLEADQRRQELLAEIASTAAAGTQNFSLQSELDDVETDLAAIAENQVSTLESQLASTQSVVTSLRGRLESAVLNLPLDANVIADLQRLRQTANVARQQHENLIARLGDLETQSYLQIADSTLVSEAGIPSQPSFPNTRLFILVAAVLGGIVATGAAILLEFVFGGITSAKQFETVLRIPAIASIARTSRAGKAGVNLADAVVEDPFSPLAESVRRVKFSTELAVQSAANRPAKGMVVLMASALSGEGKTTLAIALARTYAASNARTLLIDCDLRKPDLHRHLDIGELGGLTRYLNDPSTTPIQEVLTKDTLSNAVIVAGGQRGQTATDRLVSGRAMEQLVLAARDAFDVIILDASAFLPVVDGLYLADHADVIVYVCRWGQTRQQDAREALDLIRRAKKDSAKILGVLTHAEEASSRKYGRYY